MTPVPVSTDQEIERMESAADWLIRLNEAPGDESLVSAWLKWCHEHPENLPAFRRAQAVWFASAAALGEAHAAHGGVDPLPGVATRPWMPTSRFMRWTAAAALLAVVTVVGVWFAAMHTIDMGSQSYATPVAGLGLSVLPDGSKIELGARSRITTHYTAKLRGITVDSGEAYFSVAKDSSRPFVVTAGTVRVTALGTAFDVRRGEDRVVVGVSEGNVQIANPDPDKAISAASVAPFPVAAGEQAVIVLASRQVALAPIAPADAASWRQGVLKYMNTPLSTVVADLNRYSERRIVVTDPKLRDLPFTGTVFSSRVDDALHAFADVFPLSVTERSDEIEIVPLNETQR